MNKTSGTTPFTGATARYQGFTTKHEKLFIVDLAFTESPKDYHCN